MSTGPPPHPVKTGFLRRWPLTLKMLAITALVSISILLIGEQLHGLSLNDIFQGRLAERLKQQARHDRQRFHGYIQAHWHLAKLLSQHQQVLNYAQDKAWSATQVGQIRRHRRPPVWFPKLSTVRAFLRPRFALLLDAQNHTREIYQTRRQPLPPELETPNALLLQLSESRSYLTMLGEQPFLVASQPIKNSQGTVLATLILASPLDESFLIASQQPGGSGNIIALVDGVSQQVLASTHSDEIAPGVLLKDIEKQFLVTGKAFFDEGDWELRISLISFVSTAEIHDLTKTLLAQWRRNHLVTIIVLALSLSLLMLWITKRIGELNFRITEFSHNMGLQLRSPVNGDELTDLEDRFHRLTEKVAAETSALEHQALHDDLTGLPNRVLLYDRIEQAIRNSRRNHQPLALMMMDLNRFKEINDTLGHHVGDAVLKQVSARLKKNLRQDDTIARLGGDEFAVLLPMTIEQDAHEANTANSLAYANQVAEKIIHAVERPLVFDEHNLHVGISIGIVLYPEHGKDATLLMQRADVAMYVAKRAKKGYAIYDPGQDLSSVTRLTLMTELREAIEQDSLELYYQPKISLDSGMLCGVEALLRWPHPNLGFIPPDEFIPQAEQSGIITSLTDWVLDTALRQCAQWQQQGKPINIAVNLSVLNLNDPHLPEKLAKLLNKWKLQPELLTLEITESAVMTDADPVLENLRRLDSMGVRIAIDDFGTGYSSLAHLKQLPLDEIKIDRSFITTMTHNENDTLIVRATIDLAHNLKLKCVAEGVENSEVLDRLKEMGCEIVQGYYLSRPLPVDEFEQWLQNIVMAPIVISHRG